MGGAPKSAECGPEKLSAKIRAAMQRHSDSFPHGNWRAVNVELGALWFETAEILSFHGRSPYIGNLEKAEFLESIGK